MNSARKDGGSVTVVAGDTLSKIAEDNNIAGGWRALYESNKATLADPNRIRPGQRLTLSR
ncbi:MAG: LysM peptidoglycan-binding domain-containing protein [Pseudonocardia sp.]